ncbi:DUF6415 family natural product biosynthesis protein [Streptomyces chartreusis]|uniref:DUF6415 family natural product biosynthesis protein n=1 Tax=Streptomyces chartreusis TaxID=1969 RepID=UPI003817D718
MSGHNPAPSSRPEPTGIWRPVNGSSPLRKTRTAYNSMLWAPRLPTGAELDTLKQQLQGHVQLLVPDVQDLAPRMRGEMRRLTVHVLVRAFQLLEEYADGFPACDAFDLATMAAHS